MNADVQWNSKTAENFRSKPNFVRKRNQYTIYKFLDVLSDQGSSIQAILGVFNMFKRKKTTPCAIELKTGFHRKWLIRPLICCYHWYTTTPKTYAFKFS